MTLDPDDPLLTAYLLGELPADEAAHVERAVAADPTLRETLRELETTRNLLNDALMPKPAALLPGQREAIRRAAATRSNTHVSWNRWIVPLAAAAVIALLAAVFTRGRPGVAHLGNPVPTESPGKDSRPPDTGNLPAPGPADPGGPDQISPESATAAASELPALRPRGFLAAREVPALALPVQSGKSSLAWVKESILVKREIPDRNAVRLEEILNSFPLRPAGMTVVARFPATGWHPDHRENGATSHAATIATEALACPWKPSATLVLVSIRGNPQSDCQIKAFFRANPEHVHRYRLLGFSPLQGRDPAPLPTLLPAKSSNTLVIEVEPSGATGELGVIEWSVNDRAAAAVPLARHGDAEPSDDARFAALVCTYALWLGRESNGMIDTDVLAALARETSSESLPADRADFLNLIDRSLGL
jgi:hypothetical protein